MKREWKTITAKGSAKRILKLCGVSVIWYPEFLLYGLAAVMLGDVGDTVGWILLNALALTVSVGWGMLTGEWKDSPQKALFSG